LPFAIEITFGCSHAAQFKSRCPLSLHPSQVREPFTVRLVHA
jgi:hypothetical protein